MSWKSPCWRDGLIAMTVALVALPGVGASAEAQPASSQLGRFTITKVSAPPDVLAQGRAEQQASLMTEAVLEKSDIKEIRGYREFLRKTARLDKAAQLKAVNDYVAMHVRATADANLYNGADVWAPPINTLTLGGDCEDIALLKFWGLKFMGFSAHDLFLVVGVTTNASPPEGHAVLAARLPDGHFFILDNTEARVLPLEEIKAFQPAYAVNNFGYWKVDDPSRPAGEFWRQAFQDAADRSRR